MERLLRQTSTGRIYVATPAQEARADMVLLNPNEVELTGKGYVYIGSGRTGLMVPKAPPTPVEAFPPPPEPDPLQDSEPEPFVVDKHPSRMKTVELKRLVAEINARFPEFAIKEGLKRSPMIKACTAALKEIEALAEQG